MPTPEYHARLGASSAHRWLNCPASVSLCDGVEKTTSEYAEAGRLAHSIAELKGRKRFTVMAKRTYTSQLKKLQADEHYSPEMDGYADKIDFCVSALRPASCRTRRVTNMKDRVPTKVLSNGALRYGVYDEASSALQRYEYLKAEDAPTEEGSTLCKANLLPDDVVYALELSQPDPQIKDALLKLAQKNTITFTDAYTVHNDPGVQSATALSVARSFLAGASNTAYALFAGGSTGTYVQSSVVDAYDKRRTRQTAPALSGTYNSSAALSSAAYAFFAGGLNQTSSSSYGTGRYIDAYSPALTKSVLSMTDDRYGAAAASVGDHYLFAGGYGSDALKTLSSVEAYSAGLVHTTPTALSQARRNLAGASNTAYALFAGGVMSSSRYLDVDAYDAALTRTTPLSLSSSRGGLVGATTGTYALFAGGSGDDSVPQTTVDAYNASLTRSTPTALATASAYSASASTADGRALFNGSGTVSIYDTALTRTTAALSSDAVSNAAAAIGYAVLFAGGASNSAAGYLATVDAIIYDYELNITVPEWWAYAFGSDAEAVTTTALPLSLSGASPFSGYMRPATKTYTGLVS